MKFHLLTIFPEFFEGPFKHGVVARAAQAGALEILTHDLRQWTYDVHHSVDDRPFGGGEGMLLKPQPIFEAVESIWPQRTPRQKVILLSAQGRKFTQQVARELLDNDELLLICGRYEGVDERVAEHLADEELSIGDYVLSGGELAAACVVDTVARLLPGVLGNQDSSVNESFERLAPGDAGLLDCPQWTRPADFRGRKVPDALLSGNHAEIRKWRQKAALEKTQRLRPDLIARGLKGKSALVLAASKGLGKAAAQALIAQGARVAIGARDRTVLEGAAAEIGALPIVVDVTDPAQIEAAFAAATAAFGRIDILVNNAGGPPFGPFESFDDEQWHKALELNLMSTIRFTRLALPAMKAAGWGRIVNILSLAVKSVLSGSVLSTAGRLGIAGMSKLLADEVAPHGITINNVAPGLILTDRVRQTRLQHNSIEELSRTIPVRRLGRPEELGALVAFLASEQAGYITGTTIPVDGGAVRSIL